MGLICIFKFICFFSSFNFPYWVWDYHNRSNSYPVSQFPYCELGFLELWHFKIFILYQNFFPYDLKVYKIYRVQPLGNLLINICFIAKPWHRHWLQSHHQYQWDARLCPKEYILHLFKKWRRFTYKCVKCWRKYSSLNKMLRFSGYKFDLTFLI